MKSSKWIMSGVIMLCISCEFGPDDDVDSIENTVLVLLTESHLEVGPPLVVVHFATENMESCSNYQIQDIFAIEGDVLKSDFEGIFRPDTCIEPEGPATSTHFTDLQNGEYLLEINYEGDTDLYNVAITPDSITLSSEQASFTRSEFDVSWRYPENSFALLCGTMDGSSTPCDNFQQILEDNMTLQAFTFPDTGYVPYPKTTVGFDYNATGLFYTYPSSTDFDEAVNLLGEYDLEIGAIQSGVSIFLLNWEGRRAVIGQ